MYVDKICAWLVHSICNTKVPQLHTYLIGVSTLHCTINRMSVYLIHTVMSYYVVIDRFTVSAVIHQRSCAIISQSK